ncbi:MAG TPA: hypothetical protein VG838_09155 [Opitutaceae bacterium]|nr:hypothetical protein [Opitutaceae bacterium]
MGASVRRKIPWAPILVGFAALGAILLVMKPDTLHRARLFLRWASLDAKIALALEQDPAGPSYYPALAKGPLPLANIVGEFRRAWPGESLETIDHAVGEVAAALLLHSDVEVGDFVGKKFVPWELSPWVATEKIQAELGAANGFLEDDTRCVFRRK